MAGKVGYEKDVKPLFSSSQRECMLDRFDLWNYEQTKSKADKIIQRLKNGSMPADDTAPWPPERIAIIEGWKTDGLLP
ncbi:hypothetical protein [Bradyrhizobium niftali]|uniref:Uncharacterized protein n=1 Tax=Bradyrhizobium niftali TaxID=2560055 RepID=A0A4Y9L727_9BRAD|nr:hypothetical protein [Bradyrhizobium niftali]TFV37853.1 hypothetical protein E4K65_43120 [Bradyrhizobium niftali]